MYVNRLRHRSTPMTHPTKLTLRLDQGLIESAKAFAHEHQRSVSQLVADYFARLADQPVPAASKPGKESKPRTSKQPGKLSTVTASLRGALKTKSAPAPKANPKRQASADPDKLAYRSHLEAKHL
jgi:Family of unknown function (DUF6364)